MSGFTYAEICNAMYPLNLTVLKIVDKYFLGQTSLNITMVKSVNGKIYLLDGTTNLFEIKIMSDSKILA